MTDVTPAIPEQLTQGIGKALEVWTLQNYATSPSRLTGRCRVIQVKRITQNVRVFLMHKD